MSYADFMPAEFRQEFRQGLLNEQACLQEVRELISEGIAIPLSGWEGEDMEATVKIASVETKSGTSKAGKAWTLYRVKDGNDTVYSTFDGELGRRATALQGQQVKLSFEIGDKGNDLKGLEEVAPQDDGNPDWDQIGLRKTACHLWGTIFSSGTVPSGLEDMKKYVAAGSFLVNEAVAHIYSMQEPGSSSSTDIDEDVPF